MATGRVFILKDIIEKELKRRKLLNKLDEGKKKWSFLS